MTRKKAVIQQKRWSERKIITVNRFSPTGFRIISHTHRLSKMGGSRTGYHCPDCGCFYAEGNFTIENAGYVLGDPEWKSCCGNLRPTPRLFETLEEARSFLFTLEALGAEEKATLISRRSLITAHFNREVVTEHKRKTLH